MQQSNKSYNQSWSYLCDKLGKVPLYISNWQIIINFLKVAFLETPGNHLGCKNDFYVWCDNICDFLNDCFESQMTPNISAFLEKRRYIDPHKNPSEKYMQVSFLNMKWASPYVQREHQIAFNNADFSDILAEICNRLSAILKKCIFETKSEKSWYDVLRKIYDNFYNIKENGCSLEYQYPNHKKIMVVKTTKPLANKSYASIAAGNTITKGEIKNTGESKRNIIPIVTLEITENKMVLEPGILGKDHYIELMSIPFSTDALRKENNSDGVFITIFIIENDINIIEKLVYTSYFFVAKLKSVQFEKQTGSNTVFMDEATYALIKNKNDLKYEGEQFVFAKRRTKNFNETIDFVMIKSLIEWN